MLVPRWLQKARQIQDLLLLADFQFSPIGTVGVSIQADCFARGLRFWGLVGICVSFFLDLGVTRFLKWSFVQMCFHILPSCQVAGHFGNFSLLKLAWMTPRRDIYSVCSDFNRLETNFSVMSPEISHYEALNIVVPWPIKQQMSWELCTKSKWPLRVRPLPIEFLPPRKTVAPDSTAGRGVPSRSLRTFNGWSVMSQSSIRAMLNLHGFFLKRCPVLHL